MQSASKLAGVTVLKGYTPQEEVPQNFFAKDPMELEITGSFQQIAQFAYEIGKPDRIINVENIEIFDPKTEGEDLRLHARCLATAFHTPKPKTGQGPREMNLRPLLLLPAAAALAALAACDDPPISQYQPPPPGSTPPAGAQISDGGGLPVEWDAELGPNTFVESDRSRDPFRSSMLTEHVTAVVVPNQRHVELPQYSIDELKLQGIILSGGAGAIGCRDRTGAIGAACPRALFVDPRGSPHVLTRGDYYGKPELVHTGGANGTDYQLNWRIDRIREAEFQCPDDANDLAPAGRHRLCTRFEVNIIREDPPNATTAPARRTLLVHSELADKPG